MSPTPTAQMDPPSNATVEFDPEERFVGGVDYRRF